MRHSISKRLEALEAEAAREKIRRDEEANKVDLSLVSTETLEEMAAIGETAGGVTPEGYINIDMLSERARKDLESAAT